VLHEASAPDAFLNSCVFGQGQLDRSPTGSGVAGRAALLVARGALSLGGVFTVDSLTGARFRGRVVGIEPDGGVVAEVSGRAHILGRAEWWLDPADAVGAGFLLR
jgi:trans-L-3-hydroxyproline dehydratase